MPAYNTCYTCNNRKKLVAVYAAVSVILSSSLFAQTSFRGMNSISSPSMPTISAPSINSSFYVPSGSSQKMNVLRNKDGEKKAVETENSGKAKDSVVKNKIAPTLTANELSALSSMGLLGSFSTGISGTNLYSGQASEDTRELLEKVLLEIEEIKNNTREIPQAKPVTIVASAPVISSNSISSAAQKAVSKILRFSVNDYDILKTCGKIYISDIQQDGSFLVTGDRRYMSDGKYRTETFHMLFKNIPGTQGASNYKAAASVSQDYLNEYSFLYQLSKKSDISALRTGNFVTMRTDDPEWKMELLIDLGEK